MSKRKDLPPLPLPEPKVEAAPANLTNGRICVDCKKEARLASSIDLGITAFCDTCRKSWGVGPSLSDAMPMLSPQGFSRRSAPVLNTDFASENLDYADEYVRKG
jgi:hypothetical protein